MNEEIKIESGIPIPETSKTSGLSATMRRLEVGQSFLWKRSSSASVHSTAKQCNIKIAMRKQPDSSYRIWRKA